MHPAARQYIERKLAAFKVLEIGSLDVNGGIRDLFPARDYIGIDRVSGKGVDTLADGASFDTGDRFDLVVCCEVFEHAANWEAICANVAKILKPGGSFWGTAAGPGRAAHTCRGEYMPDPENRKEYYENIEPEKLRKTLVDCGFQAVEIDRLGLDVRWSAVK
jgi:SAM-dependent methyltransferase